MKGSYVSNKSRTVWALTLALLVLGFAQASAQQSLNSNPVSSQPGQKLSGPPGPPSILLCSVPVVTVTAPAAGATWDVGSSHNITWSATNGPITKDSIVYSTDNGSTWSFVNKYTGSRTSYSWTIPNTPSTQCKVRVFAWNSYGAGSGTSGTFTIFLRIPVVTVTAPAAGATWDVGSSQNITWSATNGPITRDSIVYSTDNGSTWSFVSTYTGSRTTCSWTIPNTPSTQCRVKVYAWNSCGPGSGLSGLFTIRLLAPMSVVVTAPVTGDVWAVGSSQNITWTASGGPADYDSIYYSTDNGSTWMPVAKVQPAGLTYNWNPVPNTPTTQAVVRVIARNATGSASGNSGIFTIGDVDMTPTAIVAPTGSYDTCAPVTPEGRVRNLGNAVATNVKVFFRVDSTPGNAVYRDSLLITVAPGAESTVSFAAWATPNAPRVFTTRCSTYVLGDAQPANDMLADNFLVSETQLPTGWFEKEPMPAAPSARQIRAGGWLAFDAGKSRIFAAKGNRKPDFYAYFPAGDSWQQDALIPAGTEGKLPKTGAVGCTDGNNSVYATKGNNTQGFWLYKADENTWQQKANVPLGSSNKKVKGGTGVVFAEQDGHGYVYLLKGYKNEFWRYDPTGDSWHALASAPAQVNVKWDKGSWLAYDDVNNVIYAHQAKFMAFYRYNVDGDSWSGALAPMPISGSTGSRKSKEGGCGTYLNGYVYALKGGNTQEFWRYTIATNSWTEKETIPAVGMTGKKKRVKAGAGLVAVGSVMYATKGNKSNEFWMYQPGGTLLASKPTDNGVMAETGLDPRHSSIAISPNPLSGGFATLQYNLPRAGQCRVCVYDVTGRTVVNRTLAAATSGSATLDLQHLNNGVYLVKLTSQDLASTRKLVVQR